MCGPQGDGAASSALFSSMALGHVSASRSTCVCSDSKPITRGSEGCDFRSPWVYVTARDCCNRDPGLFQAPQPRLKSAGLALDAWMGVTQAWLGRLVSLFIAAGAGAEYRDVSGCPRVSMWVSLPWSLCWQHSLRTAAKRGWN